MKRGELWTVSGGADYAGKPRPALIVQNDQFDATGSITICPLTSYEIDADLFRPTIDPSEANGLRETSFAMADKITTVPRERLGRKIGVVSPATMVAVGRAVVVFLGLAG